MPSSQELLDLVEGVLVKRLNGDAYESYTTSQRRFDGMSVKELKDWRTELREEVNAGNGGSFGLGAQFE